MANPGLNSILKWSIENSEQSRAGRDADAPADASRGLDAAALQQLMGGPSDADLMKNAMAVIHHPEASLENRLVAWDNLEQLIENLDNANNMSNLGLWTPLVQKLQDQDAQVRTYACWCVGTAVQNNLKSQVAFLATGAVPSLVDLAVNDADQSVRRKAVMAISSLVRNYQPALDEALKHIPAEFRSPDAPGRVDATDMDSIDAVMSKLRGHDPTKV